MIYYEWIFVVAKALRVPFMRKNPSNLPKNIIKVTNDEKDRYYQIAKNQLLGNGASGNVYKAYPYDLERREPNKKKPVVVKEIQLKENHTEKKYQLEKLHKEYSILKQYYWTETPEEIGDKFYIIMSWLPGKPVIKHSSFDTLNPAIESMCYKQRVKLIALLFSWFNLLHNSTTTSGPAIIHSDIKGENLLFIQTSKGMEIMPIDFGFSKELLQSSDNTVIKDNHIKGTKTYTAPEIYNSGIYSTKSDIYSLVPIILKILGATNPFNFKDRYSCEDQSYDFAGILQTPNGDQYPLSIHKIIVRFIERMQDENYKKRPSTHECLKFFFTLHSVLSLDPNNSNNQEAININCIKLALLSRNLWNIDIPTSNKYDHKQSTKPKPNKTFDTFYFGTYDCLANNKVNSDINLGEDRYNTKLCEAMLILEKSGLLENYAWIFLSERYNLEYVTRIIIALYKEKLLDKFHYIKIKSGKIIEKINLLKKEPTIFILLILNSEDLDSFLNNKTQSELTNIERYALKNQKSLTNIFPKGKINTLIEDIQTRIGTLIKFKQNYKNQCHTNGWFLMFRSRMANAVYKDTVTTKQIKTNSNNRSSTTYTAYQRCRSNQ